MHCHLLCVPNPETLFPGLGSGTQCDLRVTHFAGEHLFQLQVPVQLKFSSFLQGAWKRLFFFFFSEKNAIFLCLGFCLRSEVQATVQSKSVGDLLAMMVGLIQQGCGWVASSRVKSFKQSKTIGEREKEEKELQRAKGNCQSLKWSKVNPEEWGWEKSQEFLESGRTSLVQFGASL